MRQLLEKTLLIIKPDGVQRGLIGKIIGRIEDMGLKIIGMKMAWIDKEFAQKHYTEDIAIRRGKHVREWLLDYITLGPVIVMCIEGIEAIELVRKMCGETEPKKALPGTIRGDFAHVSFNYADIKKIPIKNLVHASSNKEDADRETKLWFSEKEMHSYSMVHDQHTLS